MMLKIGDHAYASAYPPILPVKDPTRYGMDGRWSDPKRDQAPSTIVLKPWKKTSVV